MASTNQTPKLGLPQFVDSDKPGWLTDFNTAMVKIDGSVGDQVENIEKALAAGQEAQTAAANASNAASEATRLAQNAQSDVQSAKISIAAVSQDVNIVQQNLNKTTEIASGAQSTAASAMTIAVEAQDGMQLDVSRMRRYGAGGEPFENLVLSGGSNLTHDGADSITYCPTKNGQYFKLMGYFRIIGPFPDDTTISVSFKTPYQPSQRLYFSSHVIRFAFNANYGRNLERLIPASGEDCYIDTDGTVTLKFISSNTNYNLGFYLTDALISVQPLITSANVR